MSGTERVDAVDGAEPPPPPRAVPPWMHSSSARTASLIGVALVVAGGFAAGLLYSMLGSPAVDDALDRRGKVVRATPVGYRQTSSSRGGAVPIHTIEVSFADADGQRRTAKLEQTHTSQVEAAAAGTPLDIEYDPQDSSRARWPGTKINPLGWGIFWICGFVSTGGAVVVLAGLLMARGARRLYRHGAARPGRVDRVEPFRENRRTNYGVHYSSAAGGTRVESVWVARGVAEPRPGPIWVIVSAKDPCQSIPVLEE